MPRTKQSKSHRARARARERERDGGATDGAGPAAFGRGGTPLRPRLALPGHVADARDVRGRLDLGRVRRPRRLALALCSMEAIELFAVRGAACLRPAHPGRRRPPRAARSEPVPERQGLRRGSVRRRGVVRCCGHLRTADSLLAAVPALPGVDGLLDGDHFTALRDGVEDALNVAKVGAALAITAHWWVG
jgi:hypothetical protein